MSQSIFLHFQLISTKLQGTKELSCPASILIIGLQFSANHTVRWKIEELEGWKIWLSEMVDLDQIK